MSKIIISFLFLFSATCFCQSYDQIDERIKNYPQFKTLNDLSIRIQNNFSTDENRIRAAFSWVAHNITYKQTLDDIFQPPKHLFYRSEFVKNQQFRKHEIKKIKLSFQNRRGVCIDYALILNELFAKFRLNSKVIVGIFKTDIKNNENLNEHPLFKNHAWNAVFLNGQWKLMDVTIASGFIDNRSNRFIRNFDDYHFFTPPLEFSKTHFPANTNWQLSDSPLQLEAFYSAPMFYPKYFTNDIRLKDDTRGTIRVSKNNQFEVSFNEQTKKPALYFKTNNDLVLKKARVKRIKNKGYISKIKLGKYLKNIDYVTLFLENEAILNFKIQKK